MFKMVNATNDNIDLLKRIRFESIPVTLVSDDLIKYVNEMTEKYLSYFKLIIVDDAIAGVFLAYPFLDGTIIDELFIYEEHRQDRKRTRLYSSHIQKSQMPSSA